MKNLSTRTGRFIVVGAIAICATLLTASMRAQTGKETAPPPVKGTELLSYEGQNVSSVELAGRPDIPPDALLSLFSQRAGQPLAAAKIEDTMDALKRTGRFQDVTLDLRPEASGVRVLFIARPTVYPGIYEFKGAAGFTYSRLLQVTNFSSAEAFSWIDLRTADDNIRTFLRRNGYFNSDVNSEIHTDTVNNLANVVFLIKLNKRADFGEIKIEGTTPQETAHLGNVLGSLKARMFGSAVRTGKKYSLPALQKATTYLESTLSKENRLEAHVQLIGAEYHPETNRADITFNVQPGPVVNVQVQGTHLWPWTKHKLLPMYQQAGLSPDLIQEGSQNLLSYLKSKGNFDSTVDTQVLKQETGELVQYRVNPGPRKKITAVVFTGNQHFDEDELEQHISVEKAHLFSHGRYDNKSVKTLKAFYQSKGFNQVKVTPEFATHGSDVTVTFVVDEGPQDVVESLDIQGNNAVPSNVLAPDGLSEAPGQPYAQKSIDDDRNKMMAKYLDMGYLIAAIHANGQPSENDPHKFHVVYEITEGPQVHASRMTTLGRYVTQQRLVDKNLRDVIPGAPLSQRQLMTSESRLYTTGVFDWAEVNPREQVTTQTQEDVIVRVHEGRRNNINFGIGIESTNRGGSVPGGTVALPGLPPVGLPSTFKTSQRNFFGPRVNLQYTRSNFRGKGESITIGGLAGPLERNASLNFQDPNFRWTNWTANFTVSGEINKQNPIFTTRQGQFAFQLQRAINSTRTQHLFLRYSATQTALTDLLIPGLVSPEDLHTRLSTLSSTWVRDTRDDILDAHKGRYDTVQLDLNPNVLGSNVNFAELLAQAAAYRSLSSGIVWANSLRIGLELASSGSHVPLSQRFFTGGGSTLRGFPLNGAGPQITVPVCGNPLDKSTCGFIRVPTGGPEMLIINSEFRIPLPLKKGLGMAVFYDGGNVFDRIGFHNFMSTYTNSVGAGLRYATPVGPIRVDIGRNLNHINGIKATQIFITLGQAF